MNQSSAATSAERSRSLVLSGFSLRELQDLHGVGNLKDPPGKPARLKEVLD